MTSGCGYSGGGDPLNFMNGSRTIMLCANPHCYLICTCPVHLHVLGLNVQCETVFVQVVWFCLVDRLAGCPRSFFPLCGCRDSAGSSSTLVNLSQARNFLLYFCFFARPFESATHFQYCVTFYLRQIQVLFSSFNFGIAI